MDAAKREMQVRTFIEEVWNGRNYQAVFDLYADTYVNPFGIGPAARAEPIRRYHQAFPDLHLDIEELIVAGDTGCAQGRLPRDRHRARSGGPGGAPAAKRGRRTRTVSGHMMRPLWSRNVAERRGYGRS
jgi:hypothetical protein